MTFGFSTDLGYFWPLMKWGLSFGREGSLLGFLSLESISECFFHTDSCVWNTFFQQSRDATLPLTGDDALIASGDDFGFNEMSSFYEDFKEYSPSQQKDV